MRAWHDLPRDADPGAPAVVEVGGTRTYRELGERTERSAAALTAAGLGPGDRVVVDAEAGADAVAMLLACSTVGAAFVPLTPEVPDARARRILELAWPHGYLATSGTDRLDRLAGRSDLAAVRFDPAPRVLHRAPPRPRAAPADPLAYLIFTSGSTGDPKGVAMPARASVAFFAGTRGMLRPADRVGSTAPLHFDFCLLDIGMCLVNGAALAPVPRDRLRWPRHLVATLAAAGATRVHAVPSVWRPLLRRQPELLAGLPPLDTVLYSGEAFPAAELDLLRAALPGTRVVSCYGPTECMACSFTDVTDCPGTGLPVDGAWPGSSLDLVDEAGRPVTGVGTGQLRFTGPSVFAGYWTGDGPRRPDTVGVSADGTPTLLTGDYADRRTDGRLVFAGRRDRQVKVGGNRVELAEVEATLTGVAGVEEARVVAHDSALVAFVAGPAPDPVEACRRACADRLPPYMRPARIVALPGLPTTPNGKVDQRRLLHQAGAEPR